MLDTRRPLTSTSTTYDTPLQPMPQAQSAARHLTCRACGPSRLHPAATSAALLLPPPRPCPCPAAASGGRDGGRTGRCRHRPRTAPSPSVHRRPLLLRRPHSPAVADTHCARRSQQRQQQQGVSIKSGMCSCNAASNMPLSIVLPKHQCGSHNTSLIIPELRQRTAAVMLPLPQAACPIHHVRPSRHIPVLLTTTTPLLNPPTPPLTRSCRTPAATGTLPQSRR